MNENIFKVPPMNKTNLDLYQKFDSVKGLVVELKDGEAYLSNIANFSIKKSICKAIEHWHD